MKKSIIYTLAISALVLSTGFTAVVSSFATTEQNSTNNTIAADNNLIDNNKTENLSKSENVYIITNSDGTLNKSFINNTINTSSEPLPLEASITYYLDGNEIKATDLVNKSGHVKITYKFTATKSYQGKLVPFLTVTSLDFNSTKFKNIKINHGKIISESDSILLAGYTFAGLSEDLNADIISDSFTVEADVTNFELTDTYTFATNELFTEIDTTKLTSIDSIVNSINDLSSAFDQILAGSSELLKGSNDLAQGAQKLSAGINDLTSGLNTLSEKGTELKQGANELVSGILATTSQKVGQELTIDNYGFILSTIIKQLIDAGQIKKATELGQTKALITNLISLSSGITDYTNAVIYISAQTPTLNAGAKELATGASQLATGANTLNSGLITFKEEGINELVNFANHDLASFTNNLRSTVNAAKSYRYYTNENATSVKFIFKTPALK